MQFVKMYELFSINAIGNIEKGSTLLKYQLMKNNDIIKKFLLETENKTIRK